MKTSKTRACRRERRPRKDGKNEGRGEGQRSRAGAKDRGLGQGLARATQVLVGLESPKEQRQ